MKRLLAVVMVLILSSCGRSQSTYFNNDHIEPLRKDVFVTKLNSVTDYFDALRNAGAQVCLPGQVSLIQRQLNSIRLESNANMWPEAIMRLDRVTDEVHTLICKLQSVQATTGCSMARNGYVPLTQWYLEASYDNCAAEDNMPSVPNLIADITLFASDSYDLNDVAKQSLATWWAFMADRYFGPLVISGHTDTRASSEYNQELSLNRANAVAEYLIGLGLQPDRIILKAMGENQPRINETNDFTRQLNRRVSVEPVYLKENLK